MSAARITLRQVAEKAQVHYATASTVLNGSKGSTRVSEETCRRVFQSAEELGYTVNRAAQQLRTRRSRVVGLLTGDLENPFFAHMVSLCSEALEREGYDVVLATRRRDSAGDLHLLESLLSRDLAGLLIWSETPTEVHTQMDRRGLTAVVMGMSIPGYDSVAGVLSSGVETLLAHLRTEGYQRIGYFAPERMLDRRGDPRGLIYREKMAEWHCCERVYAFDGTAFDVSAARAAAERLADGWAMLPPGERPDALFCFNDMNAFGAMMGLRRRGLSVPGGIALASCDDLPLARHLDVPLTTIHYPLEAVCEAAVRLLAARMERSHAGLPPLPHHTELLETKLIIRESSLRGKNA
jgi:LacI family transcriptional regulator